MFINKLPFLVSIIRGMKFTTIEYFSNKNEIALEIPLIKLLVITNHAVEI